MNTSLIQKPIFGNLLNSFRIKRGLAFGWIIIGALIAFETFNYSTTEFALSDMLGNLKFIGLRWSTILALAFCGIDFAGIARLFTPGDRSSEPNEVWYLFSAWLLAATMNAMLTWWGVSIAILNNASLGNAVVAQETMLKIVPVFVAVMVWLIRVLIIGSFSVAGNRLFTQTERNAANRPPAVTRHQVASNISAPVDRQAPAPSFRPAIRRPASVGSHVGARPDPSYHPVSMRGASPSGREIQD